MASSLAARTNDRAGCPGVAEGVPARDDLSALLGIGVTTTANPGQTIVIEDEPIEHYYRIVSGTVRLYQSIADGRRQVIDFLSDGDCFGLTGLTHHTYSVEAVSRVVMIRYARRTVEAAIEADPKLARRLLELACVELQRARQQLLLLGRKTADERMASFLLRLAEAGGETPDAVVNLTMSRLDIADHLGLTIETVSRTLSRFRRDGLIALIHRQQILLRQVAHLEALAEGEVAGTA
jgi:CRP/FNR family transcriptional regulator